MNKKPAQDEFKLHVSAYEHMLSAFPHLFVFHIPNRPGDATDGYFKKIMGAKRGAADFLAYWPTEFGFDSGAIELKSKGGVVSPDQNKFMSALDAIGVKTAVCRSVREVHTTLVRWGLKPVHEGIEEPDLRTPQQKFEDARKFFAPRGEE